MPIKSGPFNGIDRAWGAEDFARYFSSFIANGVFPNPSTNLQVVEGNNMTTVVKAGKGWINGYFIVNDNDYVLQHDNADGVLKRIDRIVMRLNHLTRQIEILVKKGVFASIPKAPALQRDADYYELALADVLINAGVTIIVQANITDQRLNNELCGIVHSTIHQVDTTTIFNQYESWYRNFTGTKAVEFEVWFDEIKEQLSGDVVGNIMYLIEGLTDRTSTLESGMINTNINVLDIALELETLKGATLNGADANILIETFQDLGDVELANGIYDSINKRLLI